MKRLQVSYSYRVYETTVIEVDDDFDADDDDAVLDVVNDAHTYGEDSEASVDVIEGVD